jgi:hypothetical protein
MGALFRVQYSDGEWQIYGGDGVTGSAINVEPVSPITAAPLVRVSANFTRPNDSSPYAAQDEVSNNTVQGSAAALTFSNVVAANGNTGYIVKATLRVTSIPATASATNAVFRLWIFDTAPTMVGDNVAWPLLTAELAKALGFVDFSLVTEGTGSTALYGLDDGLRLPFQCDAASKNLYGLILAKAGYTPTAQSIWTVHLMAELA